MTSLIERAQRFADQPALALLREDRCLPERDLNADCRRCADACPMGAIAIGRDSEGPGQLASYGSVTKEGPAGPRIDLEACVRCGSCVTACPTAALSAFAPLDDGALLDAAASIGAAAKAALDGEPPADETTAAAEGDAEQRATAGFACERAVQAGRIDTGYTAVLPCLAWVDEALIVHMACSGARRIVLHAGLCAACELAAAAHALPAVAREAQRILDAWGIAARVEVDDGVDEANAPAADDAAAADGLSRRGLFSQARTALVDAAAEAASAQVGALSGRAAAAQAAPEPDRRRWQLLDDLHAAGLPEGDAVVPRRVAPRVDIDVEHCSGCALCALFCPTGALSKAGKAAGGGTLLEFDAALCRDCGVCADTCRYGALSCTETLTVRELFALEPRAIVIPKRRVLPSRR